jgi:hypothetical protein
MRVSRTLTALLACLSDTASNGQTPAGMAGLRHNQRHKFARCSMASVWSLTSHRSLCGTDPRLALPVYRSVHRAEDCPAPPGVAPPSTALPVLSSVPKNGGERRVWIRAQALMKNPAPTVSGRERSVSERSVFPGSTLGRTGAVRISDGSSGRRRRWNSSEARGLARSKGTSAPNFSFCRAVWSRRTYGMKLPGAEARGTPSTGIQIRTIGTTKGGKTASRAWVSP